jgi:hypothetical protein
MKIIWNAWANFVEKKILLCLMLSLTQSIPFYLKQEAINWLYHESQKTNLDYTEISYDTQRTVIGIWQPVAVLSYNEINLYEIWRIHCSDYEECRLLGYKNQVCTSQETHYVSTTESSQLMLCKIWDIHGSDYEVCRLLGCYAVWLIGTEISEEFSASIIRVTRIGELGT